MKFYESPAHELLPADFHYIESGSHEETKKAKRMRSMKADMSIKKVVHPAGLEPATF